MNRKQRRAANKSREASNNSSSVKVELENSKKIEQQLLQNKVNEAFNIAIEHHRNNRFIEAEYIYREILKVQPNDIEVLTNLGIMLFIEKKYAVALPIFEKIISLTPEYYKPYSNLAIINEELNNTEKAEEYYKKGIALSGDANDYEFESRYAFFLERQNRIDEAENLYKKILKKNPNLTMALNNLSSLSKSKGNMEEAYEYIKKAIYSNPSSTFAYHNYSRLKKFSSSEDDAIIEKMLQLANNCENIPPKERGHICFAAGVYYEHIKSYNEAFKFYKMGNDARLLCETFNVDKFISDIDTIISLFTKDFFKERKGFGVDSEIPVFIVGMPRSGTTLIEQIISSHPDVFGAGELPLIKHIAGIFQNNFLKDLSIDLANDYIGELESMANNKGIKRVSDKMPLNFLHLGIISLLFPNAKIIHSMRNPLDNCLSCYFTDFLEGNMFTADLEILGVFYSQYQRLMKHWKNVLPIEIYDAEYEKIIENQEAESRKLIDFIGLEWDDKCLEFYKSSRTVQTASVEQVRKPIYKSSVEKWKNYEKHLSPLIKILKKNNII